MNIGLLLSELRTITSNNVSEERLAAYTDLCETFCEWYSVFGSDDEIPLTWKECRECLVILSGVYRQRLGLARTCAGQLRCLVPMSRLSRRLSMFGSDAASGFCGRAVDRFFTTWENAGFSKISDCEEELDLLTLIYEEHRDNCNITPIDNICRYYCGRMTEILASLLERTSGTDGCDESLFLKSIPLLAKSRGSCLDLHRDTEIRELCGRYINESLSIIHDLEVRGPVFLQSGEEHMHHFYRLRALQEIFETCRGWFEDTFYDRFVTISEQQLSRLQSQTDTWWQGQSILLRQHFAECCV